MSNLKDSFIVVYSWMTQDFNLKGNSLTIFSLLYGLSLNDENAICKCGIDHICKWFKIAKSGVIKVLNWMEEVKYIERINDSLDRRNTGYKILIGPLSGPNDTAIGLQSGLNDTAIGLQSGLIDSGNVEEISPQNGLSTEKKVHFVEKIGPQSEPYNIFNINNNNKLNNNACTREEWKNIIVDNCDLNNLSKIVTHCFGSDYELRNTLEVILDYLESKKAVTINNMKYDYAYVSDCILNMTSKVMSTIVQNLFVKDQGRPMREWRKRNDIPIPLHYILGSIIKSTI